MPILSGALARAEQAVIGGVRVKVYTFNTVVVGTGCAGYNAADSLYGMGQKSVAVVTEGIAMGTSRNTGSDKQTYYKITLAGAEPDSVENMAETLFGGGGMHGDTALVEAAMSARCFNKLTDIGVPFPHNLYGEYVGYKTDHDPRQRATSCGPLTSKLMTERLEARVMEKGVTIFDDYRVISIITPSDGPSRSLGLLSLSMDLEDREGNRPGFVLFNCTNVIYATGGPSGLYRCSVYPESQTCAIGAALEAGAAGVNLTESQYGIASLGSERRKFRWNLSGAYQQVIPRYVSTGEDGGSPREFLGEYFENVSAMTSAAFLKGYQWPFDPRKTGINGSSVVDIAVYIETRLKNRRVWLDFAKNPALAEVNGKLDWRLLDETALSYLEKSGAVQDTPIERLKAMNYPAYQLYFDNGIDLERELLEIAVCAQHNNGGLEVNLWWESGLKHFFPVGEAAGTLGVYRPGGSALNSTQVGSARAARFIASNYGEAPLPTEAFLKAAEKFIVRASGFVEKLTVPHERGERPLEFRERCQKRMDECGAFIRRHDKVRSAIKECEADMASFGNIFASSAEDVVEAFITWDILTAQFVYLSAIGEYIERGGKSRGSYLICSPSDDLEAARYSRGGFSAALDDGAFSGQVCRASLKMGAACAFEWNPVRPIPVRDDWFENICNEWNAGNVVR